MSRNNKSIISLVVVLGLTAIIYFNITIFVIQPLGMLPEGKTLVILRLNKTKFIDSADAMCEREQGEVSLFCRMIMMGAVAEKLKILLRLPYSETLYLISTQGKTYSK